MDEWLRHCAQNLCLLWFVSKDWISTEGRNFFTISYRIKKRLFFKKVYEIRMKQLYGELIKKSTDILLLVSGFVIASLIPRPRKVWPMTTNFGPIIILKNQKLKAKVIIYLSNIAEGFRLRIRLKIYARII